MRVSRVSRRWFGAFGIAAVGACGPVPGPSAGPAPPPPATVPTADVPSTLHGLWSRDDAARAQSLREAWSRPDVALPVFLGFLDDRADALPVDRATVADFLCRFRARASTGVVRAAMSGESPVATFVLRRMTATGGFGVRPERVVPDLAAALRRPEMRGDALEALRATGPAGASAVDEILRTLDEGRDDDIAPAAAALAAIGARPETVLPALRRRIGHDECARAIGAFGSGAAGEVAALAAAVRTPDGIVRPAVVDALLAIGAAAEAPLVELLADPSSAPVVTHEFVRGSSRSPGARFSAALAERCMRADRDGGEAIVAALERRAGQGDGAIAALERIADADVPARAAALSAIAASLPGADRTPLVLRAIRATDPEVRAAGARLALTSANPALAESVAALAVSDESPAVRGAAAAAACELEGGASALRVALRCAVPGREGAARGVAAAVDLRDSGPPRDRVADLAAALAGDHGPAVRRIAIRELANAPCDADPARWDGIDRAALAAGIVAWRDGDARWWPTERTWLHARAARRLGGTGAAGWDAITRGGSGHRRVVADMWETEFAALGESVADRVHAGLTDPDPAVRAASARAVPWVFPEHGASRVGRLVELLDDPLSSVRGAALRGLRRAATYDEAIAARIAAAKDDRDPAVRVAAAAALWRLTNDPSRALPIVAQAVTMPVAVHGPPNPQCEAADALHDMGPAAAAVVGELRECLRTRQHAFTWASICDTLAAIGPAAADAVPELVRAAEGALDASDFMDVADPSVYRVPAIRALERIGVPSAAAIQVLERASSDPHPAVRSAARDALVSIR